MNVEWFLVVGCLELITTGKQASIFYMELLFFVVIN
jgi:hypothetical protein